MPDQTKHSLRDLFLRNKRDLLAYLTRRVGSDDATDLLQETFVRALRYESFREVADPPAFLQRIAANLLRDLVRRRKIERTIIDPGRDAADAPSEAEEGEARLDLERQSQRLQAAMADLPPGCREVLTLAIHDNLSIEEIAARLGISENGARKQLRRAVLRCRAAVE